VVRGQRFQDRQGGGGVSIGERAQEVVESLRVAGGQRGERSDVEARGIGQGRIESPATGGEVGVHRVPRAYCQPRRKKGWAGAS
jgi:hypothetical protein